MSPTTPPDGRSPQPTVLLVDDDDNFLDALRRQFREQRRSWRLLTAGDGAAALQLLRTESVDVLVTDILMPDLDGLGLIIQLRKLDADVRVIAMSGGGRHVGPEPLTYARSLGADLVLPKPFDFASLLTAIERCLRGEPSPVVAPVGDDPPRAAR